MTRLLVWLVLVATISTALLARGRGAVEGMLIAIAVGLAIGLVVHLLEHRRLRRLADLVDRRLHGGGAPLHMPGGSREWVRLLRSVDALRQAHEDARRGLGRSEPWRRRLVGSIESPALIFGSGERLVAANKAARQLLLITSDRDQSLIQALGSAALVGAAREAREAGRPVQVDAEVNDRDVRVTASAIGDELLVILTDQTAQRRVEEIRRNFVVNASHELKTPATAIQTLSEAIEVAVERDSGRIPDLVPRLREESERLVRVVHDLLDLRRLEEWGPLEQVPVDLSSVIVQTVADRYPWAEERGITMDVDVPEQAYVAGVAQDLRLIVANLVANAVRYNRDGGHVGVSLRPEDGAYVLEVSDTGIGIPSQDLSRIFERFYRVDVGRSRGEGGTGLGLSIVRHAVERHGGTVEVESLLSEGSTFRVRLPVEARA